MRWPLFAVMFLVSASVAVSQELPVSPQPVRPVLSQMNKRAKALAKLHKELRPQAQAIEHGTTWLQERLREDDPAEYRLQLTIDDYLLGTALANPDEAPRIVNSVAADVDLKSKDCWKFGHGRRVPVEIRTVRGGAEESGWQIFYRWLPPGNLQLQVSEMAFPDPSSPSVWELPAGMYEIHIEKKGASGVLQKSNPMVIPVGTENKAAWQLRIP